MAHEAVLVFREEIEQLNNEDVKVFAQNAMALTAASFYEDFDTVSHVKKVFKLLRTHIDAESVPTNNMLRDIMLASVLLQDTMINQLPDDMKHLHPLMVKKLIEPIQDGLQKPIVDGLLSMIESHEGEASPAGALIPKPGSPNFLTALYNSIARFECVEVKL